MGEKLTAMAARSHTERERERERILQVGAGFKGSQNCLISRRGPGPAPDERVV